LLAGAAFAQLLATALFPPQAGGRAAGIGGIAGAALGVLLSRRLANRRASPAGPLARITRIVVETASPRR